MRAHDYPIDGSGYSLHTFRHGTGAALGHTAPHRIVIPRSDSDDPARAAFIDELVRKHKLFGGAVHARSEAEVREALPKWTGDP